MWVVVFYIHIGCVDKDVCSTAPPKTRISHESAPTRPWKLTWLTQKSPNFWIGNTSTHSWWIFQRVMLPFKLIHSDSLPWSLFWFWDDQKPATHTTWGVSSAENSKCFQVERVKPSHVWSSSPHLHSCPIYLEPGVESRYLMKNFPQLPESQRFYFYIRKTYQHLPKGAVWF